MRNATTLIALGIIILIGFFLRLYHLGSVPLRGDEAFTVLYWARQPLADSLAKTATMEPHPVLTYALFRGWGLLAGTDEFAMRLLPALTNMLGITALYALGRAIGGRGAGLLAALIFALHPFEIWHSQDARNYAIWAGASAVTLALGLRALRTRRNVHWFLYGLAAAITANIFYFEWFTLAAFGLYILICYWRDWKVISRWLAAAFPALFTSAVSFLILQGNLIVTGSYSGTTASRLDIPRLFTWFLPSLTFGEKLLPDDFVASLWPFIVVALALALFLLWRRKRRETVFLASLAFIPLLLLAVASLKLNIFDPRYMLSAVPAYILLLAVLVAALFESRSIIPKVAAGAVFGGWLLVAGFSLNNYYFVPDYAKSKNWPALTDYLAQNVAKSDLIIQLSVDPAFGYYNHVTADAPALPEKPSQPADDIREILEKDSTSYRSIWIVGQTFPDWPNTGVVENWLDSNWQRVNGGNLDGLDFGQYLPWQVRPDEIQSRPIATFGDIVELMGLQVYMPPNRTGNLIIWLYWKPLKTGETPLKVFVHLLGATNPATGTPLWTQDDHFPQNGRIGTTDWKPDMIYRDVYTLPLSGVPAGNYSLETGFYDPDTNQRLPVGVGDSYILEALSLK